MPVCVLFLSSTWTLFFFYPNTLSLTDHSQSAKANALPVVKVSDMEDCDMSSFPFGRATGEELKSEDVSFKARKKLITRERERNRVLYKSEKK